MNRARKIPVVSHFRGDTTEGTLSFLIRTECNCPGVCFNFSTVPEIAAAIAPDEFNLALSLSLSLEIKIFLISERYLFLRAALHGPEVVSY